MTLPPPVGEGRGGGAPGTHFTPTLTLPRRGGNKNHPRAPGETDVLSWRLTLGALLIAMLVGLAWCDFHAPRPGMYLAPLGLLCVVLSANEMVRLFEHNPVFLQSNQSTGGQRLSPSRYVVATGALLVLLLSFTPLLWREYPADCPVGRAGWTAIGLMVGVMLAVVVEMIRYRQPGVSTLRLAQAVLAISYCGGLMGFLTQLRLLGGTPWDPPGDGSDGRWGMIALLSLVAVVKACDTGAYTAGRLLGKHKMTPLLSPGKTWEGIVGGMVFSIIAAALCLGPLAHQFGCTSGQSPLRWTVGIVAYGVVVGAAGVAGDLAISLLKRDSGLKNSSTWMPGFGGVLDLLDSILFAAPVAYLFWIARVVGP